MNLLHMTCAVVDRRQWGGGSVGFWACQVEREAAGRRQFSLPAPAPVKRKGDHKDLPSEGVLRGACQPVSVREQPGFAESSCPD